MCPNCNLTRENIKTEVLNKVLKNMELIKVNELKKGNEANDLKTTNHYYNNYHDHKHRQNQQNHNVENKNFKLYSDNKNSNNENNELNYIKPSVLNSFIATRGNINGGKFLETKFINGEEGFTNNNNNDYINSDNNEFEFSQSLEGRNQADKQLNSNNFSEQSQSSQANQPNHPVR